MSAWRSRSAPAAVGGKPSCYDLASDLAGSLKGLPRDLATNRPGSAYDIVGPPGAAAQRQIRKSRYACAMSSMTESPAPAQADNAQSELARRLVALLDRHEEVLEAYLFGSQATGRAQPHSDIDVAVCVDEQRAGHSGYGYQAELASALMSGLGVNDIDVVVLNHAPPVLYHRVLRDGQRILSRNLRATTTREGYALSRYCDYVPQLAKIAAARGSAAKGTQ